MCVGGLKYTFVVGNSGTAATPEVLVRDVLPAGVIYDSFANVGGAPSRALLTAGNALECTNPSIAGPVDPELLDHRGAALGHRPDHQHGHRRPEQRDLRARRDEQHASRRRRTVTTGIDLVVWKERQDAATTPGRRRPDADPGRRRPSTEGFDPIATNGTQTYTIIVDNIGTQDATGIKVRDILPAGTKFLSCHARPTASPAPTTAPPTAAT